MNPRYKYWCQTLSDTVRQNIIMLSVCMKVVCAIMSIYLTKPNNYANSDNHHCPETEMTANIKPIVSTNTIYVGRGTKWYDDFTNSPSNNISRYLKTTIIDIVNEYDKYIDGIVRCNILTAELVCDCGISSSYRLRQNNDQCHKIIMYELINEIRKIPRIDRVNLKKMISVDRHTYIHDRIYLGKKADDPFFAVGHILNNRYRVTGLLVDGTFGCVFYGIDQDNANKQIIIKISKSDNGSIKILRSEYQHLMRLSVRKTEQDIVHDNDVIFPHVIDTFKIPSHSWSSGEFYQAMVLEKYGKDLYSHILDDHPTDLRRNGLNLKNVQLVVRQLAKTVKVLHDMKIIHKDIKCENILLRGSIVGKKEPFDIVLIDYGFAINGGKTFDGTSYYHTSGTIAYMSPEEIFGTGYNKSVDIFNIGMVIVELARGMYVFENDASFIASVYKKIYPESPHTYNKLLMDKPGAGVTKDHIGIPYDINYFVHGISDPDLVNLIKGCVTFDVNKRITIDAILKHPFLTKTIKEHEKMAFVVQG